MRICPVCQTRFKDTTATCRYCGVSLEPMTSSPSTDKKAVRRRHESKGKKAPSVPIWQTTLQNLWKKYWYWVYIICFAIIVTSVGAHYLSPSKDFVKVLRLPAIIERPSIEVSNTTTPTPVQEEVIPETGMPKSADAYDWFNKAFYMCRSGKCTDNAKAIEYLDHAIKLKPDYAEAFNNRGIAYADLGQYQNAIENYNEAIRIKPQRAESFNNRGMAYASIGQHKRAIEDYDQAILLKPNYPAAYNNRGSAYTNLNQYQRAIDDYNEAIRLKPESADLYCNRGLAYFNLEKYQNAIENYNDAIRLKPNAADIYNDRGTAYLAQGNQNSGCLDLYKACELGQCESMEKAKSKKTCP